MTMDTEQTIHDEFANGDLKFLDAVQGLQGLGYDPKEAERVVSEWADALARPARRADPPPAVR